MMDRRMEEGRDGEAAIMDYKPYALMTMAELGLSAYMALLRALLNPSPAISSVVLVVYESVIAAVVLASLAFLLERGKSPRFSLRILLWGLVIGCLEVPLGQLMLTASLRYVTASFQSVAMNTIPVVVFLLAVVLRRESFRFLGLLGQAKLWGVLASAAGASLMALQSESSARHLGPISASSSWLLGSFMNGLAVLSTAIANILVERVTEVYPATLTLSAMVNVLGTLQTSVVAVFMERSPAAWNINWSSTLQIITILYGGVVVTGLSFWVHFWCIHKKGPVFTTAFFPLLIVFSYLFETLFGAQPASLSSIGGALLVVGGLYLLLWAKSKESKDVVFASGRHHQAVHIAADEPLLSDNTA